jgi:hypothetical protein
MPLLYLLLAGYTKVAQGDNFKLRSAVLLQVSLPAILLDPASHTLTSCEYNARRSARPGYHGMVAWMIANYGGRPLVQHDTCKHMALTTN